MINIIEINTTEKARKAIEKIAKRNDLDYEFVYFLFSFCWNYDKQYFQQLKKGDLEIDDEFVRRKKIICDKLNLQNNELEKKYAIEKLYDKLSEIDTNILWQNFLYGSANSHNGYISEYATYHYLTNATKENLETLFWSGNNHNEESIMNSIFFKLFNGGLNAPNSLLGSYTDLIVKLPYKTKEFTVKDWTKDFVKEITESKQSLTDLIKILRQYCKGDKLFLQAILQSLSYSGVLKVPNIDVKNIFLPDYRDVKSKHFYSNEWTYPLRLWNELE